MINKKKIYLVIFRALISLQIPDAICKQKIPTSKNGF